MEPSDVFAGYDQIIDTVGALPVAISQGINDPVEASNVGSVGLVLQLVDTTARAQLAGEEMLATAVDSEDSEEAHAQLAIAIADSRRLADALYGQGRFGLRGVPAGPGTGGWPRHRRNDRATRTRR